MDTQNSNDLPASKGDIERILERLDFLLIPDPEQPKPENPDLVDLMQRLDHIEKLCKSVVGVGLKDVPINAETASIITGLAPSTVRWYGAYQHIDTIKIGVKLMFSLRGCIQLVEKATRKAVLEYTTDMTGYHRKKRTPRSKKPRVEPT